MFKKKFLESDDDEVEVLSSLGVDTSDIYNLDVKSETFKSLPTNMQYDVLT